MDIFNIIGYLGTIFYLSAYILLQMKKIDGGLIYTFMNLMGAILVSISLLVYWNAPSFTIQIIWIIISLFGIYLLLSKEQITYEIKIENGKISQIFKKSSKKDYEELSLDKIKDIDFNKHKVKWI